MAVLWSGQCKDKCWQQRYLLQSILSAYPKSHQHPAATKMPHNALSTTAYTWNINSTQRHSTSCVCVNVCA